MLSFGIFLSRLFLSTQWSLCKTYSLNSLSIFEVQIKGLYYFEIYSFVCLTIFLYNRLLWLFFSPSPPPAVEKGDMDRVRLCHCLRDLSILFSSLLTTSIIITIWKTKLKSFRQQRNGSQKSWQTVGEKMNLSIQSIPFLPLRQSHQSSLLLKNWEWKSLRIEKWKWKIWEKNLPHPTEHSILIPLLLNSIVETRPGPHVVAFCLKMVKNYVISC